MGERDGGCLWDLSQLSMHTYVSELVKDHPNMNKYEVQDLKNILNPILAILGQYFKATVQNWQKHEILCWNTQLAIFVIKSSTFPPIPRPQIGQFS